MSITAFELMAKLGLDKKEYEQGLNDAESQGSKFGNALGNAGKIAAVGFGAVAGTVTAVSSALVKGSGDVASYGDNIDKMSQKMGISAEAYQEWDAVLQHSGTSIESMGRGMQTLQKNAVNSADKFAKLGITQEQLASMSTEELFSATISGLQGMGEGAERTALASELLGGSAKELGALLNTSAEDTQAMKDRVHELGGVMSDEAVKSAAAYQDSLQDLQTGFDGLKRNMMSEFLPSITTVMDGLTNIFAGDYATGLDQISSGVDDFISNLNEKLPMFIEVGSNILGVLAGAIIDNLPTLFNAGLQLVIKLGTSILENLPKIVETALTLVATFAQGIADALPELIPTIVDVILKIVEILTNPDTLSELVTASIAIILALANGLIDALPQLIEAIPVIIDNLLTAFAENGPELIEMGLKLIVMLVAGLINAIPKIVVAIGEIIGSLFSAIGTYFSKLNEKGGEIIGEIAKGIHGKIEDAKDWGKDMIDNFINGLKERWENLKKTVTDIAQSIKDLLGFSEPKLGPLSNFHTYAPDMMDLFAKGIKDNARKVTGAIEENITLPTTKGVKGSITNAEDNGIIDYSEMANAVALALEKSGLAVEIDNREFGRVVRKVVTV